MAFLPDEPLRFSVLSVSPSEQQDLMTQTIALLAERLRVTEDIVRRLQGDESIASPTGSHMHNMTLGPGSTYSGEDGKHAVRTDTSYECSRCY